MLFRQVSSNSIKHVANTIDMAASQQNVANTMEHERFETKYRWNGSFQLPNAANSKENGQNKRISPNR